jgi:hypothetical protein
MLFSVKPAVCYVYNQSINQCFELHEQHDSYDYTNLISPFLFFFLICDIIFIISTFFDEVVYARFLTYFCNYGRFCLPILKMKIFSNFLIGE